jgi:hypothetical protein
MSIIISSNGKNAIKVNKSSFDKENNLQKYIYDNPESIPLYEIKEDIKLLILGREFQTNSGPIDAIGIDKYGDLYIIETKLYKNADKRTVVAQALDYGAALWKHANNFDEFLYTINEHTQKAFHLSVKEKIKEFFNIEDEEIVQILEKTKANLNDGVFHFVVLMDKIDDRLKDLILFVNQNSQFNIYAVLFEYYQHENYEIIIPKIFGTEVKKDIRVSSQNKSSERRKWTEVELLNEAQQTLDTEVYSAFKQLFDFSKDNTDFVRLGTGISTGSFGPVYESICPRSLFTLRTNGTLSFNFQWIIGTERADQFKKYYFNKLKEIGFELNEDDLEKFPTFNSNIWIGKTDSIIEVLNSF